MPTTKTIHYPISEALAGSAVNDCMPIGWLISFVEKVKARTPDYPNGTVKVCGASAIYAEWLHTLSPQEEVEDRLADLEKKAKAIRSLLPRPGESLAADAVDQLRRILA